MSQEMPSLFIHFMLYNILKPRLDIDNKYNTHGSLVHSNGGPAVSTVSDLAI